MQNKSRLPEGVIIAGAMMAMAVIFTILGENFSSAQGFAKIAA